MAERELWLLRHAKSSWDTDAPSDFDRPLNRRGKRDAPRMGRWMKRRGLVPDHIVASPARRARQTVTRLCRALGYDPARVVWDERVYAAEVSDLLTVLNACPGTARKVLLVGHNPGLVELLEWLCGAVAREDGKLLPTAALARLAVREGWRDLEPGKGRLIGIIRPRELPADS